MNDTVPAPPVVFEPCPLILTVAPATGGRVVAAGSANYDQDGFQSNRVMVVRLTATGKFDRSFGGGNGVVVLGHTMLTGGASTTDTAVGVTVQPNGKVLVAGTATRVARGDDTDLEAPRDQAFLFVRLNSNGSLDQGFGQRGRRVVRFPGARLAAAASMATDARGRILVAGRAGPRPGRARRSQGRLAIARVLTSGRLDASFGRGGRLLERQALASGGLQLGALAVQRDSKPVVSLSTGTPIGPAWVVRRYTAAGRPDPTFGTGGQEGIRISGSTSSGALAIAGTATCQRIVALGAVTVGTTTRPVVASLMGDGTPDPRFGDSGTLTLPVFAGAATATGRQVTFVTSNFGLARLVVASASCPGHPCSLSHSRPASSSRSP